MSVEPRKKWSLSSVSPFHLQGTREFELGRVALHATWREIAESRQTVLATTTFGDLLDRVGQEAEPMSYI